MYCRVCGNKLDDSAKFCPVCGAEQKISDSDYDESNARDNRKADGGENVPPDRNGKNSRKPSGPKIALGIAAAAFILASVGIFVGVMNKKAGNTNTASASSYDDAEQEENVKEISTVSAVSAAAAEAPTPTPESTEAPAESDDEDSFLSCLEENLIPQYGVMPTETLVLKDTGNGNVNRWAASDVSGLLSAVIYDFDDDGYDEMLVVRFDSLDADPDENGTPDTDLVLQMYEYSAEENTVSLCAETVLDTVNGYCGNDVIGYRQTGIFTYEQDGHTRIAVDSSLIANESISTVAVYTYIGVDSEYTQPGAESPQSGTGTPAQFAYYGGAGFQQQGSGLMNVYSGSTGYEGRSAVDPERPLFCASQTSEWTVLCTFDSDTGELISQEQLQQFTDTYYDRLAELGLSANDVRLAAVPYSLTQEEYTVNHTITPDIYTSLEGEITMIAGIYTYDASGSHKGVPLHLVRQDSQHSLDVFR